MTINQELYKHTSSDDFYPTPKAFKFMSTNSKYLKENLEMMIHKNAVWLSTVDAFNDPMEMIIHSEKSDYLNLLESFMLQVHDFIYSIDSFEGFPSEFKTLLHNMAEKNKVLGEDIIGLFEKLKKDQVFKNNPLLFIDLLEEKLDIETYFAKVTSENRKRFIQNLFVYCLTGDISNLSMWAYYAENHTGLAVEFYRRAPISSLSQQVTYTANPPLALMQNFDFLVTKNIYWRHEAERRYIAIRDTLLTNGFEINKEGKFIGKTNFFQFTDDSLSNCGGHIVKSIYMGVSISQEDKELIKDIVVSANYLITLMQCEISSKTYGMDFLQI